MTWCFDNTSPRQTLSMSVVVATVGIMSGTSTFGGTFNKSRHAMVEDSPGT